MGKLFGTDGVRGIANVDLTPQLAFELGRAGAYVLGKEKKRPKFIIGRDTRISGELIESALVSGILSMGADVVLLGVISTPGVAYMISQLNGDAGVVISSSHNPYNYNGIKFFNQLGFKLPDQVEEEIESIILEKKELKNDLSPKDIGRIIPYEDKDLLYVHYLTSTVNEDLSGFKVVLDCANGAAYHTGKEVFEALGAEVITIHDTPDGVNINEKCGSTYPLDLQEKVLEEGAHCGFAFDGDADRLIAVNEKGEIVDGDKLIYICAKALLERGALEPKIVTGTVMSNIGFHRAVENLGCSVETTQVGDRYVLESMKETGCILGGEQSGHIIFLNYSTTGDGVLAALQVLSEIKRSGLAFSEIGTEMQVYPQTLKNAKVQKDGKEAYKEDADIMKAIGEIEEKMAGEGRVLIRPSGTEPLVRVMIEGKDQNEIEAMATELSQLIESKLA